jgi:hypothetical protein
VAKKRKIVEGEDCVDSGERHSQPGDREGPESEVSALDLSLPGGERLQPVSVGPEGRQGGSTHSASD